MPLHIHYKRSLLFHFLFSLLFSSVTFLVFLSSPFLFLTVYLSHVFVSSVFSRSTIQFYPLPHCSSIFPFYFFFNIFLPFFFLFFLISLPLFPPGRPSCLSPSRTFHLLVSILPPSFLSFLFFPFSSLPLNSSSLHVSLAPSSSSSLPHSSPPLILPPSLFIFFAVFNYYRTEP